MDEQTARSLDALVTREVALYTDLLNCFRNETDALIGVAPQRLWDISKQKHALCREILCLKAQVFELVRPELGDNPAGHCRIIDLLPAQERPSFHGLYVRLAMLEDEVDSRRKENKGIIEDSIRFVDELMGILGGLRPGEEIYDNKCRIRRPKGSLSLNREV